jgi:cysteine desulfurase/selenocysteine lyase
MPASPEDALARRLAEDLLGLLGPTPAPPSLPGAPEASAPSAAALPTTDAGLRSLLGGLGGVPATPATPATPVAPAPPDEGEAEGLEVPDLYFLPREAPPAAPLSSSDGYDVATIRRDFPILHQEVHGHPLAWLDNAATTQKPRAVIDALSRFYEHDYSNIHRGAHSLAARATDAYEGAREKVRRFLGAASAEEIVFVRGTTEGINLVAQSWGRKFLQPGDEVVLTTLEHHANIVPWQLLRQELGIVLKVAPISNRGEILLEEFGHLLGPRTKLVSMTQVSNALGTVVPVKEMAAAAHRHGAVVLVDGAQSVPHLRANVQDVGADFFVFSGHKVYGPSGVGVVYGKKDLLEAMPPWQGGGSMIKDVTFERSVFQGPPQKFEAGTPTIADAVGLGAALDYVERLGLENVERHEHDLLAYGTERLKEVPGLRQIGTAPGKVSVMSFVLAGARSEDVGRYLDTQGIAVRSGHHCAQPALRRFGLESTVRPSLGLYNTYAEVDRLVEALKAYPYE